MTVRYMDAYEIKAEAEREFKLLVAEMRPKRFTMSCQISRYIVMPQLGKKYKFISGYIDFENSVSSWTFKGGI